MEQRIREFETLWNARPATRPTVTYERIEIVYRGRVYRYIHTPAVHVVHTRVQASPQDRSRRFEDYEDLEDDDEW
jgi:hypothetical protein